MDAKTSYALDTFTQVKTNLLKHVKKDVTQYTEHRLEYIEKLIDKCSSMVDFFAENDESGGVLALTSYLSSIYHSAEDTIFNEYSFILQALRNIEELKLLDETYMGARH